MKVLTKSDELVLLSVWRLGENAYGVPIRKYIRKVTGSEWSVGAIYDTLERLTSWGHLTAYQSDPTPERGGRSKRYFRLTPEGYQVLLQMKQVHETMWENLPDLGFDT